MCYREFARATGAFRDRAVSAIVAFGIILITFATADHWQAFFHALVSLITGRPVRAEVGMTGEVSLTGRVLPIGGVKQKLLAAQRAGLTEVFLPRRNEPDLDDVPAEVLAAVSVTLVSDVREILASALTAEAAATAAA